ncbi:MAG TPA: hypothetical protein PLK76_02540 [bacterium]|nr:hypothetical protein [bacterium]
MPKLVAEHSRALSVFYLKKNGFLNKECNYQYGVMTWTFDSNENKSIIDFSTHRGNAHTPTELAYIKLSYTHTNYWTGEKSDMDFKVSLTTTPCNYGGVRYWFICPITKNGQYCGRRVGVLYGIGKWFGCRHCGNIAYNSQRQSERYKGFVSIPDIERAEEKVKRYYYKGKPTRKYRQVLKLNKKFERGFFRAYMRLNKKNV